MTKTELIDAIRSQINGGISKQDIDRVLSGLGRVAQTELGLEEGEIPLPGIGKLKATVRAGRSGHNPATGEAIDIPPMNAIKFVAGKEIKRAIQ